MLINEPPTYLHTIAIGNVIQQGYKVLLHDHIMKTLHAGDHEYSQCYT